MRYLGFYYKVQEHEGIKIKSFLEKIKSKCKEADKLEEYGANDGCIEIDCKYLKHCNEIIRYRKRDTGPAFWSIRELENLRTMSGEEVEKQTKMF